MPEVSDFVLISNLSIPRSWPGFKSRPTHVLPKADTPQDTETVEIEQFRPRRETLSMHTGDS